MLFAFSIMRNEEMMVEMMKEEKNTYFP